MPPHKLVENENLRFDKPFITLGSGSFGTVYRGSFLGTDGSWHPCAIKLLKATDAESVDGELSALAQLSHANIVRLIGRVASAARVGIVTELLTGGSLHSALDSATKENKPPSFATRLRWCTDVGAGLVAMHAAGLVHGDVKTTNAMLDGGAGAKIIDLGLVKAMNEREGGFVGTLNYAAPELMPRGGRLSEPRTDKADVYAFGCLVYSVFSRREPFHEQLREFGTTTSKKYHATAEKGNAKLAAVGALLRGDGGRAPLRPNLGDLEPAVTPLGLRELLERCWRTDHRLRPSMAEALAALRAMAAPAASAPAPKAAPPPAAAKAPLAVGCTVRPTGAAPSNKCLGAPSAGRTGVVERIDSDGDIKVACDAARDWDYYRASHLEVVAGGGGGAPSRTLALRSVSTPPSKRREPHRHYLSAGVRAGTVTCDVCKSGCSSGMLTCAECNYDECPGCFSSGPSQRRDRPAEASRRPEPKKVAAAAGAAAAGGILLALPLALGCSVV
jgi:hypothetical protein